MGELLHRDFLDSHPEEQKRQQERERARAIDTAKRKRKAVEGKKLWIPVGRDSESGDIVASVFGSAEFAKWTDASRPDGAALEPDDTLTLLWALSLLAENRGNPVEFHFQHRPRPGLLRSFSDERLKHLSKTDWLSYEVRGAIRRLGLGPRTERLRREFAEAFIARGKEELAIERKAKRSLKTETDTTAS